MDSPTLPATIVAPLDAFVRDLVTWASQHRDADLSALEQAVREGLRALAPQLVGGLIAVTQRSLDPSMQRDRPRCPACGALGRLRGWRPRQMHTTCGRVSWERPWAQCPACRASWSPTDQTLGIQAQQRISVSLRDWLVTLGALLPFRTAAEQLTTLTGVTIGTETTRTITEAAGTTLDQRLQEEAAIVERTKAPAGAVDAAPDDLVAETDGVMVRYLDGWHEVKLGVVGGWDPTRPRAQQQLTALSYGAARASVTEWAARWGAEVARRGGLEEVSRLCRQRRGARHRDAAAGGGARGRGALDLERRRRPIRCADRDRGLVPRCRACLDDRPGRVRGRDRGSPGLG